jgi:uncharacterized membrane protein
MGTGSLVVSVFLASTVEMVEALTIVLASALARGWRSALVGTAAAAGCLTLVVAALGPALTQVPLNTLRTIVGVLLLIFGLQWLRKAILRASGYKALHDETEIFTRELTAARSAGPERSGPIDPYGFTLAFKGVLLEGLEVAFIVVTFGSAAGRIGAATLAALAALALVAVVGALARAPLARVPENAIKLAVGVLLTTFGTFWSTDSIGSGWPGGDAAIAGVLAFVIALTWTLTAFLRRRHNAAIPVAA